MELLDGKLVAKTIKSALKVEVENYLSLNYRAPHIAIILVGHNEASEIYVRNKVKACDLVKMQSTVICFEENITTVELIDAINQLNNDSEIDGIIVQLPLPKHIDEAKVIDAVKVEKDVDGFNTINKGRLFTGLDAFYPATPFGIIKLLEYYQIDLTGTNAVVVGRSNIVGKPMAMLLLSKNVTVTVCHSKTKNLNEITSKADLIVMAIGKAKFLKEDMVKDGAIIVDVGMNRDENGLCGDVDFANVSKKASFITPVPGGVGPLTIAMLLANTLRAYKNTYLKGQGE